MIRPVPMLFGAAALLTAAADAPSERVVTGDGVVPVTVAGLSGRIRVDPGAPSMPLLGSDYAVRAGLRPGMFATRYAVGPVSVEGSSAVTQIDTGTGPRKRRIAWAARRYTQEADGAVGPGGMPEDVIRFVLRPASPGDRTVALPMVDAGGIFGGWGGLFAQIDVAGEPLKILFDLRRRNTVATAGAGARLATALGGRMEGAPETMEIAFGVERPVRHLRLARPLDIGPLSFDRLSVRVADFGNASTIADEKDDPDEVVVRAGKKHNPARDRLSLALDQLDRCSSIVFDKPRRVIRLTCS